MKYTDIALETLIDIEQISREDMISMLDVEEHHPDFDYKLDEEVKKYQELYELYGDNIVCFNESTETFSMNGNWKSKLEYNLCKVCIEKRNISDTLREKLSNVFEKIVGEALIAYLGKGASYKIIDNITLIGDIKKVFKEEVLEKVYPNLESTDLVSDFPIRCDIVVWKKIDNRRGKIILLVECKSGRNWKSEHSINIALFKNIVQFTIDPIRIFAIADLLEEYEIYIRSTENGLILDRPRIVSLLANVENNELKKIRGEIQTLLSQI